MRGDVSPPSFAINATTGALSVTSSLDREVTAWVRLVVEASDMSALCQTSTVPSRDPFCFVRHPHAHLVVCLIILTHSRAHSLSTELLSLLFHSLYESLVPLA